MDERHCSTQSMEGRIVYRPPTQQLHVYKGRYSSVIHPLIPLQSTMHTQMDEVQVLCSGAHNRMYGACAAQHFTVASALHQIEAAHGPFLYICVFDATAEIC